MKNSEGEFGHSENDSHVTIVYGVRNIGTEDGVILRPPCRVHACLKYMYQQCLHLYGGTLLEQGKTPIK